MIPGVRQRRETRHRLVREPIKYGLPYPSGTAQGRVRYAVIGDGYREDRR
jgi:hypothetical protein